MITGLVIGGYQEDALLNGGIGIFVQGATNTLITACFIGLSQDGITPFPNFRGIQLLDPVLPTNNNTIGGTGATDRNLISGNTNAGIFLEDANANQILGNYIGVDLTGTVAVPNLCGVAIAVSSLNTIGGNTVAARNIISGNTDGAIDLTFSDNNSIQGNYMGTDLSGTTAVPNGYGIRTLLFSASNQIGGTFSLLPGAGNLISGNLNFGIQIEGDANVIEGNLIGVQADFTSPLGNGSAGIIIAEGSNNRIGGANNGNIIANNTGNGIQINSPTAVSNQISQNAIFSNAGIGIDLGNDGLTANDMDDLDGGANVLQNFAEMTNINYNAGITTLNLTYEVASDVGNTAFPLEVEFFVADPNGQGQAFIGADTYTLADFTTGPQKAIGIIPQVPIVLTGTENFVNTATDANNNTSEFSFEVILSAYNLSLKAEVLAASISLSWQHNQEGLVKYVIERASASKQYEDLSESSGNAMLGLLSFEDTSPLLGRNRYRLRLHHIDGSISYSNVVEAIFTSQDLVHAYVYEAQLHTTVYASEIDSYVFQLFDLSGRLAKKWRQDVYKGKNEHTVGISELSKGTYLLIIPKLNERRKLVIP